VNAFAIYFANKQLPARYGGPGPRAPMIQTLCLLLSLVFALLATAAVPQPPRFHFLSFAVAMLALALLVGHTIGGWNAQGY
jgi:hypothetical protein